MLRHVWPSWRSVWTARKCRSRRPGAFPLVEWLEQRTLLSIDIVFDYTYDTNGFFNAPDRRLAVEMAARLFEDAFANTLTAITPSGTNHWSAQFTNPQTGGSTSVNDLVVPANQVIVYLGARNLTGSEVGEASTGYSASGTSGWLNTVVYRGEAAVATNYAPWGGSIAFDSTETWFTGVTTTGLTGSMSDLYSVAVHELGHLMGFLSSYPAWSSQVAGGFFTGPNAQAVYGPSGLPVTGGHLQDNLMSDGQEVAMSPIHTSGLRETFTTYDWAILDDLGWTLNFDETAGNPKWGHLVVQVVDTSGNPLAGQQVTLSGTGSALKTTGTTDAYGLFTTFVTNASWTASITGDSSAVAVNGLMKSVQLTAGITRDDVFGFDAANNRWRIGLSSGSSFTNQLGYSFSGATDWQFLKEDFNGDGRVDVAAFGGSGAKKYWWIGLSNGSAFVFSAWSGWGSTAGWQDFQVGDFNGDGKADVIARTSSGEWWAGLSTGSSFTTTYFGRWSNAVTWVDVKAGDFNGDGRTDIIGRQQASGQWYMALSTGSFFSSIYAGRWNASVIWQDVSVGDFDGDGRDDIAGRTSDGYWWISRSTGAALATYYGTRWSPTGNWVDVTVGDFDGDGKDDIAGRTGSGEWWLARSTGTGLTNAYLGKWNSSVRWTAVVGDFNGDGRTDIAGFMVDTGQWWVSLSRKDQIGFSTSYFGSWGSGLGGITYLAGGNLN